MVVFDPASSHVAWREDDGQSDAITPPSAGGQLQPIFYSISLPTYYTSLFNVVNKNIGVCFYSNDKLDYSCQSQVPSIHGIDFDI